MAITKKEKYIAPTTTFDIVLGESIIAGGASGTGSDVLPDDTGNKGETDPGHEFPSDARFQDNTFDYGSWDF